eukprot:jgi/Bigna1/75768/fgenesh1_pg.37_\
MEIEDEDDGVGILTMGIGVGDITDDEIRLRMEAEKNKMRNMTDDEIGYIKEEEPQFDSDEEFLRLCEGRHFSAQEEDIEPTPEFQKQWNNYMGIFDKRESDINEHKKHLDQVRVVSKKVEEEVESAKDMLRKTNESTKVIIAAHTGAGGENDDDDENSKKEVGVTAKDDTRQTNTFSSSVVENEQGETMKQGGIDQTEAQSNINKSDRIDENSHHNNDRGNNNNGEKKNTTKRKKQPSSSLARWIELKEREQRDMEKKRREAQEVKRQAMKKRINEEMERLRREAERHVEQQQREQRRRAKKRARLKRQREEKKRELDEKRKEREKLQQEQAKSKILLIVLIEVVKMCEDCCKARGHVERQRMSHEDRLSRALQQQIVQNRSQRQKKHMKRMYREDTLGYDLMKIHRAKRRKELALRESRRMRLEDDDSRIFSRFVEKQLQHERALKWTCRMREEDQRCLTVMTIERLEQAKKERERKRQLDLLRERKKRMRIEAQRHGMQHEDNRSSRLCAIRVMEKNKRRKQQRHSMQMEDIRGRHAARAERALKGRFSLTTDRSSYVLHYTKR